MKSDLKRNSAKNFNKVGVTKEEDTLELKYNEREIAILIPNGYQEFSKDKK